jgi:hypothetical protein
MSEAVHDHSRWGPDDQLGAANLLTLERRLSALRSIRDGTLCDLSHEISAKAPFMAPNQTPFLMSIWASWRDSIKRRRAGGATNDAGSNVERVDMTMHVGTHIDALGHSCRIALASTLDRGGHHTATIGVFGTAAAAGKLLSLNPEQMLAAFGIAEVDGLGDPSVLALSGRIAGHRAKAERRDRSPSRCRGPTGARSRSRPQIPSGRHKSR